LGAGGATLHMGVHLFFSVHNFCFSAKL